MKKPIIGIISQNSVNNEGRSFLSKTNFSIDIKNSISESNGIPIGLLLPLNERDFTDISVDGYVFQGGTAINVEQIMAMHYAIKSDKPILGICMGMQLMALYSYMYDVFNGKIGYQESKEFLEWIKGEYFLKKVSGHDNCNPFYIQRINESLHKVNLDNNSRLSNIYGESVMMPSVHNYAVRDEYMGSMFQITGRCDDGVIEVIEGNNFDALGVQFHPEVCKDKRIFEDYIKRVRVKRRSEYY